MKIRRVDAFAAIAFAMEQGRIPVANQMLKIVSKSITADKKKKTFSSFIELSNKELNIFRSVMPSIEIYGINIEQEYS